MEKLKKTLSSPVSVKAVQWKGWGLWREGFKEKVSLFWSLEWKRVGLMDNESGDDGTDEIDN